MLKFSGFANLTSCLESCTNAYAHTQLKKESKAPSPNVAQQPNDTNARRCAQ